MQLFKHKKKGQFDVMKNAGVGVVGLFIVLAVGALVLATIQSNIPDLGGNASISTNVNRTAIAIVTQGVTNLQLMSSLAVVVVIVVIAVIIIGFFEKRQNGL